MKALKKLLVISDSDRVIEKLNDLLKDRFQIVSKNSFTANQFQNDNISAEYILVDFILLNDFKPKKQEDEFYTKKLDIFHRYFPGTRVLVLVDSQKIEEAGTLLKLGFNNIIQIPFSKEILEHRLFVEEERVKFKELAIESAKDKVSPKNIFRTENNQFSIELEKLEQVAQSRSTVLITGESGTGKSLLAKHIHQISSRKDHHFVEVHCGAIPETLVESELFGHEKGSFTGAIKRKIGKFELSNKGTIFLDEIGTVSKSVQVRLLQVLQERFIQRVGGEANISLDIRVIAATNNDLKSLVDQGEFREDLFYRLNVFHIELPALRNRKEDIPLLCESILKKLNLNYGKNIEKTSKEVLSVFHNYNWPGNVRELENILERAYVLEKSSEISVTNIPLELIPASKAMVSISPLNRENIGLIEARKEATEAFEQKYLTELLIAHHGKVSAMAKEAQVSIRQLHKLMAKHSIKSKNFSIKLDDSEEQ